MTNKGFRQKLTERQKKENTVLCVGLDPLEDKIPKCIKGRSVWSRVLTQMTAIIDATQDSACMFKPQKAHYEAIPDGQKALQGIVDYIHNNYPDIPVFLDCKRGDIDRTQEQYRIAHFDIEGVDGMNFSPYMGKDCMQFLVDQKNLGRAIVGLCYTSNPSARETQDVLLGDGRRYWEFMADTTFRWAKDLGIVEDAGLVMAAAYELPPKGSGNIYSEHLLRCRQIVGNHLWFLVPGIGAQGGFIEKTIEDAYLGYGSMAINSSSGITFKSMDTDYAKAAGKEASDLSWKINEARLKCGKSN